MVDIWKLDRPSIDLEAIARVQISDLDARDRCVSTVLRCLSWLAADTLHRLVPHEFSSPHTTIPAGHHLHAR